MGGWQEQGTTWRMSMRLQVPEAMNHKELSLG